MLWRGCGFGTGDCWGLLVDRGKSKTLNNSPYCYSPCTYKWVWLVRGALLAFFVVFGEQVPAVFGWILLQL